MLELRLAQKEDNTRAMELIQQAKDYFKDNGVDQWQQGYPDAECIARDIEAKKGFMMIEDTEAVGYLCLDFDGEESYSGLKGQWKSDKDYAVIHRMAVDNAHKGKGLSTKAFKLVEDFCLQKGIHSIKVDTDEDNVNMRHALDKNGFEYCGKIWFDYSEKVAYERVF